MDDVILHIQTFLNLSKHQMTMDIKTLNYTLSPEPISTAVAMKCVIEILDAKNIKRQIFELH